MAQDSQPRAVPIDIVCQKIRQPVQHQQSRVKGKDYTDCRKQGRHSLQTPLTLPIPGCCREKEAQGVAANKDAGGFRGLFQLKVKAAHHIKPDHRQQRQQELPPAAAQPAAAEGRRQEQYADIHQTPLQKGIEQVVCRVPRQEIQNLHAQDRQQTQILHGPCGRLKPISIYHTHIMPPSRRATDSGSPGTVRTENPDSGS